MNDQDSPLVGPPPPEVPLNNPPLIRVIAQVRFPVIASVERREFVAPFQEAIRKQYPSLRPEQNRGVVLGPQGVMESRSDTIWRFHDSSDNWCVTLAPDFLALETSSYASRDDFLQRLRHVLCALETNVDPQLVDRLGLRYIDRITGTNLAELPQLVRPEVCGVLGTTLSEHALQAVSENVFVLPDETGQVRVRWGLIPAHGTVDPGAIEPIENASWLLDVDAFQSKTRPLDVNATTELARKFAERIYSIFRWTVTDEFLRRYGGQA